MPRWLKFTAIGCGGLVSLFILLGIAGALFHLLLVAAVYQVVKAGATRGT